MDHNLNNFLKMYGYFFLFCVKSLSLLSLCLDEKSRVDIVHTTNSKGRGVAYVIVQMDKG